MTVIRLVALGVLALALVACQPQAAAPAASPGSQQPPAKAGELTTFKVAAVSKTALYWPSLIAEAKGFYTEQNLAPDVLYITPSANLIQQLGAGSIDIGQADAAQMIRAAEKGAHLKFIAGGINAALYRLLGQPDVKTVADLKGKTIVVDSASGQTKYMVQQLLRAQGLQDNDYTFIYSGSTTDRFSQLKSRAVAAAVLTQPFDFRAEDEGYTVLGDIADLLSPWTFNAIEVNTDWAKDHQDVIVRYLKAMIKATDFLYANQSESIQILMQAAEVPEKEAQQTYDLYRKHTAVPEKLAITDESIQRIFDYMVDVGDFKEPPPTAKYIDRGYWEKATQG